ncbi:PLP-dependent aminotransferase family protein [Neobittarella massiliensis]|uniref:MocR-like pyridoxine biosynthesis transcription factor PdxR n=1 Tax=Neobittarella massiliensis (ex Bilen et al. 2018) TaxID=2041842 RepID=UPI0013EBF1EB|nr:PLP-dependent aminotransferase family protein [Neobittarella massiliensis]
MFNYMFQIDRSRDLPLQAQLCQQVQQALLSGALPGDSPLPSIRGLAAMLGVSKTTVESAYAQLLAEGYIVSRPGSGHRTASLQALPPTAAVAAAAAEGGDGPPVTYDMSGSTIDPQSFPTAVWKRYLGRALTDAPPAGGYGDAQGEYPLRQQLAAYSYRSRGVVCSPQQIVVGAGVQSLLALLCAVFRRRAARGDGTPLAVGLEKPGFLQARQVLCDHGFAVCEYELDQLLAGALPPVAMLYCDPQNPGHAGHFGAAEKLALLRHCDARQCFLLEDDYAGEFRYLQRPIPALQGMRPQNGQVIYMGSFSRLLLPSIRVSYLVLPPTLLPDYRALGRAYNQTCSSTEQLALSGFIADGHLYRHIGRLRRLYGQKSRLLKEALRSAFGRRIKVLPFDSGLQLLVEIDCPRPGAEIESRCRQAGLICQAVPVKSGQRPRLLLGFCALPPEKIAPAAALLCAVCDRP